MAAHLSEAAMGAMLKFLNKIWESRRMGKRNNSAVLQKLKNRPHSPAAIEPWPPQVALEKSYQNIINTRLTFMLKTKVI